MTIENVRIKSTQLGIEDHGIFSFLIFLDGDGWGTGFGGITLDGFDTFTGETYGWNKAIPLIRAILDTVGVENWEDLKGQLIRAEFTGIEDRVTKIGNIVKDNWFDLDNWINK